jgi:hypothetical protein
MLAAALLVVPAIAIKQSEATGALNTVAIILVTSPFLPASLHTARVFRLLRLLPLLRAGLLARRLLTT